MFETLTEKLQRAFKNLRGQGKLSEEHLDAGLAEIREALLDGDVNVGVADEFIAHVRAKALGSEVLLQLSPDQQVVKIVRDELGELLGKEAKPQYGSKPPAVWLVVGLQGSAKLLRREKWGNGWRSTGTVPWWFLPTCIAPRRASNWRRWRRLRACRCGRERGRTSRWKLCAERCAKRRCPPATWCWWIRRGGCI